MTTYAVVRKADAVEVFRYQDAARVEWAGFEFATHDHIEVPEIAVEVAPQPVAIWGQTEFLRRFSLTERIAARELAKTDPVMAGLWGLLTSTAVVHSNDPDVIRGLGYMVQAGVLTPTRRDEILGVTQ